MHVVFFWYPGWKNNIETVVNNCEQCTYYLKTPAETIYQPWSFPGKAWQRIHMDFAGPYQNIMFLVLIDAHSK